MTQRIVWGSRADLIVGIAATKIELAAQGRWIARDSDFHHVKPQLVVVIVKCVELTGLRWWTIRVPFHIRVEHAAKL